MYSAFYLMEENILWSADKKITETNPQKQIVGSLESFKFFQNS